MTRKSKDFQDKSFELIQFYREYPVLAAQELLFVDLPAPQRVVFEDMWFKPFSLVTAGRGSGKCLKGDTIIPTDTGLVYLDSIGSKLNPLSDVSFNVIGKDGVDTSTKWYYNGFDKVNTVTTNFGYSVSGTDEHTIVTLNNSGRLEWKLSSDIIEGDILVINRKESIWSNKDHCTLKEATFLGLIIGDGCTRGGRFYLAFCNGDEDTLQLYKSLVFDIFKETPRYTDSNGTRCGSYITTKKHMWKKLGTLGLPNNTLAKDKYIPESVMNSGKKVM